MRADRDAARRPVSTPPTIRIRLLPLDQTLEVPAGTSLQDLLFPQGVEFPCGGRGRCKGCRIRVLEGALPVTPDDERLLSAEERAAGWRLSCRARPVADVQLELAQWEAAILADESTFSFTPQDGLGVAVDLGTTTIVAQLLDLRTGHVLGVRTALNQQARHGADIMSRVDFALTPEGRATLGRLIREQLGALVTGLVETAGAGQLRRVVIVGNTVMHHLFCDVGVEPLAHHPFEPVDDGLKTFRATELGWIGLKEADVQFLPSLGGFVGSDILAGILATRLDEREKLVGLVDLGTNGEMVIGNRKRLLCASTAAGPAFEGARISMGMRAATGAVAEVEVRDGTLACRVLGHGTPRGICGSGLVDAVAGGLELGWIQPTGRLAGRSALPLLPPVTVTQTDIRELQLAKGAIAAGVKLLVRQWGAAIEDLTALYLAGAFGNYINRTSAHRIGLLPVPPAKVEAAGNTALLGAKLALFQPGLESAHYKALREKVRHVSLNDDPEFHDLYVSEMQFPSDLI